MCPHPASGLCKAPNPCCTYDAMHACSCAPWSRLAAYKLSMHASSPLPVPALDRRPVQDRSQAGSRGQHNSELCPNVTFLQATSLMAPYLPPRSSNSPFSEGGGLYALGLIHANHGEPIIPFLLESLRNSSQEVGPCHHRNVITMLLGLPGLQSALPCSCEQPCCTGEWQASHLTRRSSKRQLIAQPLLQADASDQDRRVLSHIPDA